MGEVYEAEDLELRGDHVAIKTILAANANDQTAVEQFKREIQLARKVTHPNVCRIFDLVYDQRPEAPVAFLTMELLNGETLAKLIEKSGSFSLERALPLARQMAEGLHAAHQAGVVHQDFKSGNVIVEPGKEGGEQRAVITDFGLAHNFREAQRLSGKSGGTPAYMAPEQIEGKPISAATDVYAFGVVLYELLTGHWPYNARTPQELRQKKLDEAPVLPSKYVPDLPPRAERAILRCLSRSPEERFQDPRDAVRALEAPRISWKFLTAAALIVVVLAGFGIYKWRAWLSARQPAVAVIGFKNNTGSESYDWLATELSETLTADLTSSNRLRVAPADEVARLRTELSIPPTATLENQDLSQVRAELGVGFVVFGSYNIAGDSGNTLTVDLRLQSPQGETDTSFHESGSEADYRKLTLKLAEQVRNKLGTVRLSRKEGEDLQNIFPADADARKWYFLGLDKLRSFDAPAASKLLQQAAEREPSNVAIHSALADAWAQMKLDPQAAKEAKIASELAEHSSLPLQYVVLAKARADEMDKHWDGAISNYETLFLRYQRLDYGLQLASAQMEGSRASQALQTLAKLTQLPAPMGNDPRIQLTRAKAYGAMNDYKAQLDAAQTALQEATQRNSRMMQANAQLQLCWAHRNLGDVEEAYKSCNAAQNLFSVFGDNVSAAVALNDVATWLSDRGKYPEAKALYDRVIQVNLSAGAQKDYAGACVNAAKTVLRMGGKPEDAEAYIQNALSTADAIGDKSDEVLARIIYAEIRREQGRMDDAENEVRQALSIAKGLNQSLESLALSNLASYQGETNVPEALQTYTQALQLREKNKQKDGVANCLNNMGEMLFRAGNLQGAEQKYQQALKLYSEELKDNNSAAQSLLSLAEVDFERDNLALAEDKALKALREFQSPEDKDVDSESEAAALLVRIYAAEGKPLDAEPYVRRIQEIASKDRDVMFGNRLSIAEYLDAIGKHEEAIQELQLLPAEAKAAGRNFVSLQARLALVKLREKELSASELRKELSSIRTEAMRAGFRLLAERATLTNPR